MDGPNDLPCPSSFAALIDFVSFLCMSAETRLHCKKRSWRTMAMPKTRKLSLLSHDRTRACSIRLAYAARIVLDAVIFMLCTISLPHPPAALSPSRRLLLRRPRRWRRTGRVLASTQEIHAARIPIDLVLAQVDGDGSLGRAWDRLFEFLRQSSC